MLNHDNQRMIVDSFTHVAEIMRRGAVEFQAAMDDLRRPAVVYKPRLFMEGNQWCALYGDRMALPDLARHLTSPCGISTKRGIRNCRCRPAAKVAARKAEMEGIKSGDLESFNTNAPSERR